MTSLPPDFAARAYAGWVGKCVGVRYGAPTESLSYDAIRMLFGELSAYLQTDPRIFHPDDDLTGPILFLRALDDYGDDPPESRFGDVWLNSIGDAHGTLWWGGYGISTEHTAYVNLANGISAPRSGSAAQNGLTIAEQIGGQIFSDGWGLICPNNPLRAAELARRAASVSHDGNAVFGGMFVAAMNAIAFSAKDIREVIERALDVIPVDCTYARVTREVMAFHDAHPADWRACYEWIRAHHGYAHYPGRVHVIPNAALIVMGLLYGEGNFARSLSITHMGGWDTDCNVGNVGCVLGVLNGIEGIPAHWRAPMNDRVVIASLFGARNLTDMGEVTDAFVRHAHRQAGLAEPAPRARFHFGYPGGTQGFEVVSDGVEFAALQQTDELGESALKLSAVDLFRRRSIGAFVRTYVRPAELDGNNYKASFSPRVYPGQTITARVMAHAESDRGLIANLFVHDANANVRIEQSPGTPLAPGQWTRLEWRIPPASGACVSQAGLLVTAMHPAHKNEAIYVTDFDWGGAPDFAYDFSKERIETDACSQWTYLRGYWALEDGAYVGSGMGQSETYSGDTAWRDYTLRVRLRPIVGDTHMILARVQGAIRSYALALKPGRLVLLRNDKGYDELASTPFEWEHGVAYELSLTARGSTIEGRCGDAVLSLDDPEPYLHGMIGLANGPACRTAFEHVEVRP